MPPVLGGLEEHRDPGPDPELTVRITVPEEFTGSAMGLLNSLLGVITGLDVQEGETQAGVAPRFAVIKGSLPQSEYRTLVEELAQATQARGKVQIEWPANDPNQSNPGRGGVL